MAAIIGSVLAAFILGVEPDTDGGYLELDPASLSSEYCIVKPPGFRSAEPCKVVVHERPVPDKYAFFAMEGTSQTWNSIEVTVHPRWTPERLSEVELRAFLDDFRGKDPCTVRGFTSEGPFDVLDIYGQQGIRFVATCPKMTSAHYMLFGKRHFAYIAVAGPGPGQVERQKAIAAQMAVHIRLRHSELVPDAPSKRSP